MSEVAPLISDLAIILIIAGIVTVIFKWLKHRIWENPLCTMGFCPVVWLLPVDLYPFVRYENATLRQSLNLA